MKKKDQIIADEIVTYKLNLIKYGNKTVREVLTLLTGLEKDILKQLDGDIAEWEKSRLNRVLTEIGETSNDYYSQIAQSVSDDLVPVPLAAQKAVITPLNETIGAEFTALASPKRLELLSGQALIQGAPGPAWWKKQDNDLTFKVQNVLRQGYAQGIGARVIASDVIQIMGVSRRDAETLVRTSYMTVSNKALDETYRANSDIIDSYEWLSTLDSRTCKYCMSMDGRTWNIDAVKPDIPAHMNCRCIYAPIIKTWRQLGIPIDELPPARRDMDGVVEGDTTFDGFLKRKGPDFQNDMLGTGRADLWKEGKITISDLVNNRGRELSLSELKSL